MKIIIVRHAQTDENASGGLAARTSEALLNEEGIKQAEKLREHLKGENITHAYVSPQKRAVHTAEKILQHHPHAVIRHADGLREQSLGIYEQLPKAEFKEIRKASLAAWHEFKPQEGESYAELQQRVKGFFMDLEKKHPNDTVLLVSHGGPLGVLLVDMLGKELTEENYRTHQPKNAEFTVVEVFQDGKKQIHKLNSREHLDA